MSEFTGCHTLRNLTKINLVLIRILDFQMPKPGRRDTVPSSLSCADSYLGAERSPDAHLGPHCSAEQHCTQWCGSALLALTDGPSEQSARNWTEEASVTLGSCGSEIIGGNSAPSPFTFTSNVLCHGRERKRAPPLLLSRSPMHPQVPAPKRGYRTTTYLRKGEGNVYTTHRTEAQRFNTVTEALPSGV